MALTGHTAERKPRSDACTEPPTRRRRVGSPFAVAAIGDGHVADVDVVPGSLRSGEPMPELVEWLRRVHPTTSWSVSVGTGSSYLAAAGVLGGGEAATHWAASQELARYGVCYSDRRVVQAGKVLTSAGIDVALTLLGLSHGPAVAHSVQLALEDDPQTLTTPALRRRRRARSASS